MSKTPYSRTLCRNLCLTCAVLPLLFAGGCKRFRKTRSAPKSADYADKLRPVVASGQIKVMKWPNFADYEPLVQTFYDDRNYEVAWVDDGKPSKQATAFIQAFKDAATKGLNPEDFDASLWDGRVSKLAGKNDDDIAQFDATMTVCVMRYISDLRLGRVNPTHFNFDINTQDKKYNLPEFVSDNAVDADDVPKLIASVEPDNTQYRKTEDALVHYLELAKQQSANPGQPLSTVAKALTVNSPYAQADALRARLQLEGDLPGSPMGTAGPNGQTGPASAAFEVSGIFTQDLSDGVKHYQERHGMAEDGKLTPQVIASLNVPLSARVQQLSDSLERWRWLPNQYVDAPLMVNLPEFVLRGYQGEGPSHTLDFTMKVVDGKALGEHDTPVFTREMKYVIFRPYWNVPISIIKKELAGHIEKSGVGYLAAKNFETVNNSGQVVQASAAEVIRGGVNVREKPGPKNSLGLIKFMFPNEYDIYLHSTPQPELFSRTRRDFSHGCVRVQHPDELAAWVMKRSGTPGDFDLQQVQDAMNNGPDNHQVNLKQPLPIVIFYLTANTVENGETHFYDDIYGYDQQLDATLAKGMPYPSSQGKVNPKTTPGDRN